HLPYGDKSEAAIQAYSVKIADFLYRQGCKVIVIACNSASSAAYELLKEYIRKIKIINVIDPMIEWVSEHYAGKQIGLIGTRRTIQSGVYARKLEETKRNITLHAVATPLLAPMIEEGFFNNRISHDIIAGYLSAPELRNIDALILGCTHYPLIKQEIASFYDGKTAVLDSSEIVARAVALYLQQHDLFNQQSPLPDRFMVSDYTEAFESSTRIFFGRQVKLEEQVLWD
ncbi:MAG: aspartate/glutamate racemase family protein, partial [Cyclobacteriaceae bacterium]|nr:aspartate/glutamate racemase family protein [Cyclobacteriaceae bacterium]